MAIKAVQILPIKDEKVAYSKVLVERIPIQYFEPGEGPKGYVIHVGEGRGSYHAGRLLLL